jgi:uncharacterized protein (DUF1800 family)
MSSSRRSVAALAALALLAGCASAVGSSTTPGALAGTPPAVATPIVVVTPTEPREQTADQQVQQVLNRLAFGARPEDVANVRRIGVDRWIALQLAPDRIADTTADRVLASYEMLGRPTSDLMALYEQGQIAIRKLQKQSAQRGDSANRQNIRAQALRDDPGLRDRLRQTQRVLGDVQSARLARAVVSDRQLDEVMTDFWENHFTVYAGKGLTRFFIPAYDREVIRPHALGHFRELLGAVAKSPAMLFFLDQWQSAGDSTHTRLASRGQPAAMRGMSVEEVEGMMLPGRALTDEQRRRLGALTPAKRGRFVQQRGQKAQRARGLNENYARELMELHTLGVDGGYSQQDVIEVARALTGWTMAPRQGAEFVFRPQIHDAGAKTVLGHHLAAGRGIEDGEDVLDLLARDPHTAHFIAKKLAIRFVSDVPPTALVDRATATYLRTDGDIREVVRTIVTSPEFFSRAAYRSKVKTPFELVASALRAVGAAADTTLRSAQVVGFLGQPIFGHQAPDGWPETGDAWMNAGAILNRINFGFALAGGRLPGAALSHWPESARLSTAPRDEQVDAVVSAFLGGQSSPDTRDILLKGENPLAAKLASTGSVGMQGSDADRPLDGDLMSGSGLAGGGTAKRNGQPRPAAGRRGGGLGPPVQLTGLAQVVGLAIGAPEFQRR